jgi:hypothetical protein
MGLVWDMDIPANEKLVLLAYADHAHHDGTGIYPAIKTIMKKTGYSERSVQEITRSLEKNGLLITDGKGPKGTNKWRLGVQSLRGAESAGVQPDVEGGAVQRVKGVQPTAPEPSVNHQEPSRRTQAEKKGDIMDGILSMELSPLAKRTRDMQLRVEGVLKIAPAWDGRTWSRFDRWLIEREDAGERVETWAKWWLADDFRRKLTHGLTPDKIKQSWPQAFGAEDKGYNPLGLAVNV